MAIVYFLKHDYNRSWNCIQKLQSVGYPLNEQFVINIQDILKNQKKQLFYNQMNDAE